jgi:hypothetical protein
MILSSLSLKLAETYGEYRVPFLLHLVRTGRDFAALHGPVLWAITQRLPGVKKYRALGYDVAIRNDQYFASQFSDMPPVCLFGTESR